MNTKEWKWWFINDHTGIFNKNILKSFYPSEIIYVDKSFSEWYGLGGDCINLGLPDYVQIDHKIDAG